MQWHGPFFRNVLHDQVYQFQKGIIRCKSTFCFSHFSDLPMEALNGIGSINYPSDMGVELKEGGQVFPVILPGGNRNRIFFAPFLVQGDQVFIALFLGNGLINRFKISHKSFFVFFGNIA